MDKICTRIRDELNLTRAAMAERLGCSASMYTKVERGERNPGPDLVRVLWELCPHGLLEDLGYAVLEAAGVPVIDCYRLVVTAPEPKEPTPEWDDELSQFIAPHPAGGEVYGHTRSECADKLAEAWRVYRQHQEHGLDPDALAEEAEWDDDRVAEAEQQRRPL